MRTGHDCRQGDSCATHECTRHVVKQNMSALKQAAAITWMAQYVIYGLSFVRLVIASRLLSSAEIGAFVLASSLVLLASVPRVFGTQDYIVATKDLTQQKLATCFTLILIMGTVVGLIYILGASWLADYFSAPVLGALVPLMAISFLILPFGLIGQGIMRRDLRIGQLAAARSAGAVAETVVVVMLLWSDVGVLSLAWGFLVANIVVTAIVVALTPSHTLFRPGISHMRELLRFGAPASAGTFLAQVGGLGPPLLLGRVTDASTVGFFGRGQTLINFFRQGVETAMGPIVQPWFAQVSRNDPARLVDGFCRVMRLVLIVTWPFYTFLFLHAPALVPLVLGPGWDPAVPVTQALAVGGLFSSYVLYADSLLIGRGRVRRRLILSAVTQGLRFALLGVALATGAGLTGFAWTLSASNLIALGLAAVVLRRDIGLGFAQSFGLFVTPLIVSVAIFALNAGIVFWLGSTLNAVLSAAAVTALLWGGTIILTDHPLYRELTTLIKRKRPTS